jgi:hypothetical protein
VDRGCYGDTTWAEGWIWVGDWTRPAKETDTMEEIVGFLQREEHCMYYSGRESNKKHPFDELCRLWETRRSDDYHCRVSMSSSCHDGGSERTLLDDTGEKLI